MLWLGLLGVVILLSIAALFLVLRRQEPLGDELYANNVAMEHVHSGVAWIRPDGVFGSANPSLARTFQIDPQDLLGKGWLQMFPAGQHPRLHEHYSEMLLKGMASFDARGVRSDGSQLWLNVRLVAVHDRKMRFAGHHCLIEDHTRALELEERIRRITHNSPISRIYAALHEQSTSTEASTEESEPSGLPVEVTL